MAFPPAKAKDHDLLVVNPVTGKLDTIRKFNPDRIITAQLNSAGNPRLIYDAVSNTFIEDGATVVIDNNGNVVKV